MPTATAKPSASATPVPVATASATPVAVVTATPSAAASDDAFNYTGTLVQTYILYGTPAPAVSAPATAAPTATPWVTTLDETVAQTVSVTGGASFGSSSGLTDLATSETDTSVHGTTTSVSNAYEQLVPDATRVSGIDVTEVGSTSSESSGVAYTTTFGSGNGIVEELPHVLYARWTNSATRTATERDPDGQVTTSTYAAPGTYTETVHYPEQDGSAQAVTYGDGSGVYQMPVGGETQQNSSITVSAPTIAASGNLIAIGFSIYGAGFPQAGGFTLADWYPATPPVLASDQFVDTGTAALPAACNVPAAYGAGAFDAIVETRSRLDTLFGELETDSSTAYVSSTLGVVCTVVRDDLKNFYDFSAQSSSVGTFSSTPIYETIVTETVALTAAGSTAAAARSSFVKMPSLAHVRALIEQSRTRMLHALHARSLFRNPHT